jgi:hypothetical protein
MQNELKRDMEPYLRRIYSKEERSRRPLKNNKQMAGHKTAD